MQVEYNLVYRPSPAVVPPSPSSPISILRGSPSTKASTAYRGQGNTPPITTYKPVVHRVKSTAAVSRPRPDSDLVPSKRPRTSAVPSKRPGTPASKKPRTTTATRASAQKSPTRQTLGGSSIGSKRKNTPNLHPHTFFHEEQAKQVKHNFQLNVCLMFS